MVTNVDLILSSVLTANIMVASIVPFPNNIINLLAMVVCVFWLLSRNKENDFDNNRLKGA